MIVLKINVFDDFPILDGDAPPDFLDALPAGAKHAEHAGHAEQVVVPKTGRHAKHVRFWSVLVLLSMQGMKGNLVRG